MGKSCTCCGGGECCNRFLKSITLKSPAMGIEIDVPINQTYDKVNNCYLYAEIGHVPGDCWKIKFTFRPGLDIRDVSISQQNNELIKRYGECIFGRNENQAFFTLYVPNISFLKYSQYTFDVNNQGAFYIDIKYSAIDGFGNSFIKTETFEYFLGLSGPLFTDGKRELQQCGNTSWSDFIKKYLWSKEITLNSYQELDSNSGIKGYAECSPIGPYLSGTQSNMYSYMDACYTEEDLARANRVGAYYRTWTEYTIDTTRADVSKTFKFKYHGCYVYLMNFVPYIQHVVSIDPFGTPWSDPFEVKYQSGNETFKVYSDASVCGYKIPTSTLFPGMSRDDSFSYGNTIVSKTKNKTYGLSTNGIIDVNNPSISEC